MTGGRLRTLAVAFGLAAITFAFLLRFRNEGIFHLDAIFLATAVEDIYAGRPWTTGWRFGAVLANAVVYFPFWLAGDSAERSTIVASILYHSLSISVAFALLLRLTGRRVLAALAAGLLALAPVYTISNTFGKEYGLAMLLLLGSFHLAVVARERASAAWAGWSAATLALSFVVWEGLLVVTAVHAVLLLAPRLAERRLVLAPRAGRLALGALFGLAAGLAFDLSTSLFPMLRTYASVAEMSSFLGFASPVLPRAAGDLVRALGPAAAAAVLGLAVSLRGRHRPLLLPAALLILTVVFYGNLSSYGPRYLVVAALGACVLAGVGFEFLIERGRLARVGAIAAYVAALGWMLWVSLPLLEARRTYNGVKRFALFVAEVSEPESAIIVMDESPFIEYYAHRAIVRKHPIGDAAATARWIETVEETLARRPVYLAESGLSYDPGSAVQLALMERFAFEEVGSRLSEDFHHAEGRLRLYQQRLWRLKPKRLAP